jgi:hypothetical protein
MSAEHSRRPSVYVYEADIHQPIPHSLKRGQFRPHGFLTPKSGSANT